MPHPHRALFVAVVLTLVAAPAARAQSLWPAPLRGPAEFGIEWVRPTFKYSDDAYSGTRGIWILSGRFHPAPRLNAVVAIPRLVATDADGGATMGDPYAGIELLKDDGTVEFSLGTRIDMIDNTFGGAPEVGFFGDFDRFEQAISHAFTLTATGYHEPFRSDDGTFARIRFGATFLHPTGEGFGAENDLYFNYGIRMGRETPSLRFSVELTGRWLLTANGANFGQASIHQGAATASFFSGQVRPYVGIRVPVDEELKSSLRRALIFGVTVGVE